MLKRLRLVVVLFAAALGFAQVPVVGNPVDRGPSLPTTCYVGQGMFFKTSAVDGLGAVGIYSCNATNTWTGPFGSSAGSDATTVNGQTCTLGSTCAVESATSGQIAISGGSGAALTGAADLTYATHTFSAISTTIFDLSPATGTTAFKVPSTTTNTASAAGGIDYDTTNSNYHAYSGADSLIGIVPTASVPTTGHVIDALVASSKFLLHDSGAVSADLITYHIPATGIARTTSSSQAIAGSEISGDCTTSGSNAITCKPTVPAAGSSGTFSGSAYIFVCSTTCTITVPVPAAGLQYCAMNGDNVSTVITLSAIGSSARYENQARTAYGTAGTGTLVSAGAVKDSVCILGLDSTHYLFASGNGTWTAN